MSKTKEQEEKEAQDALVEKAQRALEGFSLGDIFTTGFWLLVIGVVLYYVAKMPQVQAMIPDKYKAGMEEFLNEHANLSLFPGAMRNLDATTIEAKLMEDGTAEPVAKVISANWKDIYDIAAKANDNKATRSTMMNGKTIAALLREKPQVIDAIVQASPAPSADAPAKNQKIMTALAELVQDKAALDSALELPHARVSVAKAIQKLAPGLAFKTDEKSTAAIAQFISTVGMKDGKTTPAFQQFLLTSLAETSTPEQTKQAAAGYLTLAMVHAPAETRALLATITPDETLRPVMALANSERMTNAFSALAKAAGDEKTVSMVNGLLQGNTAPLLDFALTPAVLSQPNQWQTLAEGLTPLVPASETGAHEVLALMLHHPHQTTELLATLGPVNAKAFIGIVQGSQPQGQQAAVSPMDFVLRHADAFTAFTDSVDQDLLPPMTKGFVQTLKSIDRTTFAAASVASLKGVEVSALLPLFTSTTATGLKFDGTTTLDTLLHPQQHKRKFLRTELGKLNDDEVSAMLKSYAPGMTKPNLLAVINYIDAVEAQPANQGETADRTQRVLVTLTGALLKQPQAMQGVTGEELATFFSTPENRTLFGQMLRSLDLSGHDSRTQRVFRVLRDRWLSSGIDKDKPIDDGFAFLLTDPKKAEPFLQGLRDYAEGKVAKKNEKSLSWSDEALLSVFGGDQGKGFKKILGELDAAMATPGSSPYMPPPSATNAAKRASMAY